MKEGKLGGDGKRRIKERVGGKDCFGRVLVLAVEFILAWYRHTRSLYRYLIINESITRI